MHGTCHYKIERLMWKYQQKYTVTSSLEVAEYYIWSYCKKETGYIKTVHL
jgi:hypothetical protein